MRIAQVAPLNESVPPNLYGGTERVVSYLIEELVRLGHDSDDQRRPISDANWQATIYHGLPRDLHTYRKRHGEYLAFLGRMSPEKRADALPSSMMKNNSAPSKSFAKSRARPSKAQSALPTKSARSSAAIP
jgi:hypothetical protein